MSTLAGAKLGLPVPDEAIQLPLGESGDLAAWAESAARARLGYEASPQDVAEFADVLLTAGTDSEQRGATLAFWYSPFPTGGEVARIEVRDYVPSERQPDVPELATVVDWFASPLAGAMEEPEVVYGETPLGPAARLKMRVLSDGNTEGAMTVLNNSVYIIRPRERECVLVLNVTWASGAFTAQLDTLADQLAQGLRIL
ncbi:hypothetical protein KGQ20_12305 [Catenulispora sp. NF23]|uniref:Uncharacterized protein n=1 Tax=Catenulispora pinistramenti TaxID=2705254 RepID=A0ABS5KRS5_9ACTN|nr:hypothetical protein [Catenulispora pinistramenti]MBS2533553.1 hypothetical protein [Catenulispora pinistramenti]MBS2548695.1 hypothetical protein [Catenulispora pinistramenti]